MHVNSDVPFNSIRNLGFFGHFEPSRLSVPRYGVGYPRLVLYLPNFSYQNIFRIVIWLFFLLTYSQAGQLVSIPASNVYLTFNTVRQPLEKLDSLHQTLEVWEYILYIMTLAFTFEGKPLSYARIS